MQTEMLIGSKFEKGTETEEQILNPKTGETILDLPEASQSQIEAAVAAAEKAFATWSRTTPAQRSGYLLKIADRIEAEAEGVLRARGAELRQADQCGAQRRDPGDRRLLPLLRRRGAHACPARSPANICRASPRWSGATRSASSPPSRRGTIR